VWVWVPRHTTPLIHTTFFVCLRGGGLPGPGAYVTPSLNHAGCVITTSESFLFLFLFFKGFSMGIRWLGDKGLHTIRSMAKIILRVLAFDVASGLNDFCCGPDCMIAVAWLLWHANLIIRGFATAYAVLVPFCLLDRRSVYTVLDFNQMYIAFVWMSLGFIARGCGVARSSGRSRAAFLAFVAGSGLVLRIS